MRFADLFCGAGFGARGAVAAGATPVIGVDAWDVASATYQENFPTAHVITDYLEHINPRAYRAIGPIDLLLASPECTSHSLARGSKPPVEASRMSALRVLKWVEEFSPRWVILENVVRMKNWDKHEYLTKSLEGMGYAISQFALNAADFGVAQSRRRLFVVGGRAATPPSIESLNARKATQTQSVRGILDPEGTWRVSKLYKKGRAENTLARAERAISEVGSTEDFILVYYGTDHAGGWQPLDRPLRTITTLDRFALVTFRQGKHWMRMLQPSELKRAMAGNLDHKLNVGTRRDKVKLCGNGICSPVVKELVSEVMEIERRGKLAKAI